MYVYYLVSAIIWDYIKACAICEVSHKGLDVCIMHGLFRVVSFSEYLYRWWVSSHYQHLNGFLNHGMLCVSVKVMLLVSSIVSKHVILLLRSQAGFLLEETTTTEAEHMTRALRQLYFPWRSQFSPAYTAVRRWMPPCSQRGAELSLA